MADHAGMHDTIIHRAEIIRRTGRPDSSLRRDIRLGEFPRLLYAGPSRRGVLESELALVIAARVAGASRQQLRSIVQTIHDDRRRMAVELGFQEAL